MINPIVLRNKLLTSGFKSFVGVPDSILRNFTDTLRDSSLKNLVVANEGNAVAVAIGEYLGSGNPSVVYMQNSGFGNAINPLVSLADESVYSIPMLLIIGWRGEPGEEDEPQHGKQGNITTKLLELLEIPFVILNDYFEESLNKLIQTMSKDSKPVALIVPKNSFLKTNSESNSQNDFSITRVQVIRELIRRNTNSQFFVATTGYTARELYEIRKESGKSGQDFLSVGAMGHVSSIALGMARNSEKQIICLDGDGSLFMHMGSMTTIGKLNGINLIHIIFNNGMHQSVGGQPTGAANLSLNKIAENLGYDANYELNSISDLNDFFDNFPKTGKIFVDIKISNHSMENLSRPPKNFRLLRNEIRKIMDE